MSRCELTGKGPVVVNLVSHSNIKTKSRSLPNIQNKKLFSPALNQMVSLKIAATTIKSIGHVGNLDKYILGISECGLSARALTVKRRIQKRISGKSGAAKSKTTKKPKSA